MLDSAVVLPGDFIPPFYLGEDGIYKASSENAVDDLIHLKPFTEATPIPSKPIRKAKKRFP